MRATEPPIPDLNTNELVIEGSGIKPLVRNALGIIFYITVINRADTEYHTAVKMIECCEKLTKEEVDCKSMELLGGYTGLVKPGETKNLTLIYHNLYPYHRKGFCMVAVWFRNTHGKIKETKARVKFSTRLKKSSPSHIVADYYEPERFTECPHYDLDPLDDCLPVDCSRKYNGKKVFYSHMMNKCLPAPICLSDSRKPYPDVAYMPDANLCVDLEHAFDSSDVRFFADGIKDEGVFQDFEPNYRGFLRCHNGRPDRSRGSCVCDPGWTSMSCGPGAPLRQTAVPVHLCTVPLYDDLLPPTPELQTSAPPPATTSSPAPSTTWFPFWPTPSKDSGTTTSTSRLSPPQLANRSFTETTIFSNVCDKLEDLYTESVGSYKMVLILALIIIIPAILINILFGAFDEEKSDDCRRPGEKKDSKKIEPPKKEKKRVEKKGEEESAERKRCPSGLKSRRKKREEEEAASPPGEEKGGSKETELERPCSRSKRAKAYISRRLKALKRLGTCASYLKSRFVSTESDWCTPDEEEDRARRKRASTSEETPTTSAEVPRRCKEVMEEARKRTAVKQGGEGPKDEEKKQRKVLFRDSKDNKEESQVNYSLLDLPRDKHRRHRQGDTGRHNRRPPLQDSSRHGRCKRTRKSHHESSASTADVMLSTLPTDASSQEMLEADIMSTTTEKEDKSREYPRRHRHRRRSCNSSSQQ